MNPKFHQVLDPNGLEGLCAYCEKLYKYTTAQDRRLWRADLVIAGDVMPWPQLIESLCPLCQVFRKSIQAHDIAEDDIITVTSPLPDTDSIEKETYRVHMRLRLKRVGIMDLEIFSHPGVPCPWGVIPPGSGISPAGGLECRDKILSWVKRCQTSHKCGHLESPRLPLRVLDLSPARGSSVMLHVPGGETGQYTCLSHRWGDQQPLVTTSTNINAYTTKGIPWEHFPKTYQDAMDVNRLLGIRYIWIDSLCIIQDSREDWEEQSSKMCQIYSNAFLTIAATSSRNCLSGFPMPGSRSVRGTNQTGKSYHVFSHAAISHPLDINLPEGHYSVRDNADTNVWPLLTRAWVFQERMLSPRVLHFSKDEMIWECDEDYWCECGRVRNLGDDSFRLRQRFKSALSSDSAAIPVIWRSMVSGYSNLALKFPSDRLPALSGLAQRVATRQPSKKYLAGVWADTLEMDLLWHAASINESPVPLGGGCAPSWSWAGRAAHVGFPKCHISVANGREYESKGMIEKWFKIINVRCIPATVDPAGQTKDGRLTIEVQRFATILRNIGDKYCQPETSWALKLKAQNVWFPSAELFCDSPQNTRLYKLAETRVTCARLALVEVFAPVDGGKVYGVEYVLVLVPSEADPGAYERMGMIVVHRYFEMNGERYAEYPSPFGAEGDLSTIDII